MKIKITIVLLLLSFQAQINAQISVKVTYEQQNIYPENYWDKFPEELREKTKKLLTALTTLHLINNGDTSLIISKTEELHFPSTQENKPNEKNLGETIKLAETWVYKDFNTNTTTNKIELNRKNYYKQNPFDKTIYEFNPTATKKIDNYDCNLAYYISKKSNDTIKYWYAKEIAIADGPFETSNIPGLILRYENKYRVVYATKIEFIDSKINIEPLDPKIPVISNEEYLKLKAESLKPKEYVDEKGKNVKTTSLIIK